MIEEVKDLEELAQSFVELLGLPAQGPSEPSARALSEPEHLSEMLRSLLVEFFGMEVKGL